jgi:hypothetical protein
MFLTKDDLKLAYGVDMQIGEAFVNRLVPQENLYWKNRKIYLPGAPGYTFLPIFADLLLRSGASTQQLTAEGQFQLSEAILHSAALLEHQMISWDEHLQQVMDIVSPKVVNAQLFEDIKTYIFAKIPVTKNGILFGTEFPSLNRADSYLFILTAISAPTFNLEKAIRSWYALMTYFLILDDLADIKDDLLNNEENALIDAGLNESGVERIGKMIDDSISVMHLVNPVMANRIEHKKSLIDLHEIIRSIRLNGNG